MTPGETFYAGEGWGDTTCNHPKVCHSERNDNGAEESTH